MKELVVAAVQARSDNGAGQQNLDRATPHVAAAAAEGAKLVLCPEFLAAGYIYEETIWSSGERRSGITETWLADLAKRHDIYVGASYLEADGDEFYNTFTLMAPGGKVAGRVRKESLPFFEGWFFRPCSGPKVIETELGRIGVGICNDTQTAAFLAHMTRERPDLILMPHSAPTPTVPLIDRWFAPEYDRNLRDTAARYAGAFGVPVVMCNKADGGMTETALPIAPFVKLHWQFRGHSSICDSDGRVVERLDGREGIIVGVVNVDEAAKSHDAPRPNGYWSFPPPYGRRILGKLLITLDRAGRRAYGRSETRRLLATQRSTPRP